MTAQATKKRKRTDINEVAVEALKGTFGHWLQRCRDAQEGLAEWVGREVCKGNAFDSDIATFKAHGRWPGGDAFLDAPFFRAAHEALQYGYLPLAEKNNKKQSFRKLNCKHREISPDNVVSILSDQYRMAVRTSLSNRPLNCAVLMHPWAVVIDLDMHKGEDGQLDDNGVAVFEAFVQGNQDSLASLRKQVPTVPTSNAGMHLHLRASNDQAIKMLGRFSSKYHILAGVEVVKFGAKIAFPGSRHIVTHQPYAWDLGSPTYSCKGYSQLPEYLFKAVCELKYKKPKAGQPAGQEPVIHEAVKTTTSNTPNSGSPPAGDDAHFSRDHQLLTSLFEMCDPSKRNYDRNDWLKMQYCMIKVGGSFEQWLVWNQRDPRWDQRSSVPNTVDGLQASWNDEVPKCEAATFGLAIRMLKKAAEEHVGDFAWKVVDAGLPKQAEVVKARLGRFDNQDKYCWAQMCIELDDCILAGPFENDEEAVAFFKKRLPRCLAVVASEPTTYMIKNRPQSSFAYHRETSLEGTHNIREIGEKSFPSIVFSIKGRKKPMSLLTFLKFHPNIAPKYKTVTFQPSINWRPGFEDPDTFNRFPGLRASFEGSAKTADMAFLEDFLLRVLCNRCVESNLVVRVVLYRMVVLFQRSEWLLTFITERQRAAGKTFFWTWVAEVVIGLTLSIVLNGNGALSHLFNAHTTDKILVVSDEVSGSDHRDNADKEKGLSTQNVVQSQKKFKEAQGTYNCATFISNTNHLDAITVTESLNERNFPIGTGCETKDYFNQLDAVFLKTQTSNDFLCLVKSWGDDPTFMAAVKHHKLPDTPLRARMCQGAVTTHQQFVDLVRDTPGGYLFKRSERTGKDVAMVEHRIKWDHRNGQQLTYDAYRVHCQNKGIPPKRDGNFKMALLGCQDVVHAEDHPTIDGRRCRVQYYVFGDMDKALVNAPVVE